MLTKRQKAKQQLREMLEQRKFYQEKERAFLERRARKPDPPLTLDEHVEFFFVTVEEKFFLA